MALVMQEILEGRWTHVDFLTSKINAVASLSFFLQRGFQYGWITASKMLFLVL